MMFWPLNVTVSSSSAIKRWLCCREDHDDAS
jgi:hypothetical protein